MQSRTKVLSLIAVILAVVYLLPHHLTPVHAQNAPEDRMAATMKSAIALGLDPQKLLTAMDAAGKAQTGEEQAKIYFDAGFDMETLNALRKGVVDQGFPPAVNPPLDGFLSMMTFNARLNDMGIDQAKLQELLGAGAPTLAKVQEVGAALGLDETQTAKLAETIVSTSPSWMADQLPLTKEYEQYIAQLPQEDALAIYDTDSATIDETLQGINPEDAEALAILAADLFDLGISPEEFEVLIANVADFSSLVDSYGILVLVEDGFVPALVITDDEIAGIEWTDDEAAFWDTNSDETFSYEDLWNDFESLDEESVDESGTDESVDESGTEESVDESGTEESVDESGTDTSVDESGTDESVGESGGDESSQGGGDESSGDTGGDTGGDSGGEG